MLYQKDLKARWNEYANLTTARNEGWREGVKMGIEAVQRGIERGIKKGAEGKSFEVVKKMLLSDKFTIAEIADLANVTEAFVNKVKKNLK
jgi:hypothetical protein